MGTVVREDGRDLMIRRVNQPYLGMWAMPGGRLEVTGGTLAEQAEGPLQWVRPEDLDGTAIPSDMWMLRHMLLPPTPPVWWRCGARRRMC
jgi:hypothetical protein